MATPLAGNSGGSASDSFLPMTGFGPGSIIIAVVGGVLTLCGAIAQRVSRRRPVA
jgi:hypothetical protein